MDIAALLKTIRVTGKASVLHKPGGVRLDAYPGLVYAPAQWGPGVRVECNGTPVEEIVAAVADAGPEADLHALAARFGCSEAHVVDALLYAREVGYLRTGE